MLLHISIAYINENNNTDDLVLVVVARNSVDNQKWWWWWWCGGYDLCPVCQYTDASVLIQFSVL